MPNTTETAAAVRAAKDDHRAAEVRLAELTDERNRIDDDLRDATVRAAREKAEAARAGDPIVAPADLDAVQLRERRESLPYEVHAQEIYTAECELALYDAQDADRQARHAEAEAVFAEVAPRFEAVKKEYEEAVAARRNPERGVHATYLRREAEDTLAGLQASPPGLDAPAASYSPGAVRRTARDRMTIH